MVQVEFLDPDDPARTDGPDVGEEIGRDPSRWAALDHDLVAGCVLFAAAAVLAVIAPFQQLFVIRQPTADEGLTYAMDGWGRISVNNSGSVATSLHSSRFGLPLAICAGLLTVLVLALATTAVRGPASDRLRRASAGVAIALTGLLTGLFVAMWLLADAELDNAQPSTVDVELGPSTPNFDYGACLWLAAAAVLASALGTGAVLRRRSRE
jgi:hypothetical protein